MWKGVSGDHPQAGVTQSLINRFLECPYSFYLYAILGLREEEGEKLNLIWGDCFHKGLELLIPGGDFKYAVEGMREHLETHYPEAPTSFYHSLPKMLRIYRLAPFKGDWVTEEVIDTTIDIDGLPVRFRGKRDGQTHNHPDYGSVLAEHKCKGYIDPQEKKEELCQDLQCNLYLYLNETEWVFYDLIKIPDTQKYLPANTGFEDTKEYITSLYQGPCASYGGNFPIYTNKTKWIHQLVHFFPQEEQEVYWQQTIIPIVKRMHEWYEYVTDPSFDPENPDSYSSIFYKTPVRHFNARKTEKFKCPYHGYLTGQIELDSLIPIDSYFGELEVE